MRDIAVFSVIIAACVMALRQPYYGFLCWVWLSLMNPHRLAYGWVHDMPVALITILSTMVGTLLYKEKARLFQHGIVVLQIFFVIWIAITTIFAMFPDFAYNHFDRAVKIQLGVLLSYLLVDSKQKIIGLISVMFLSVGFYGTKGGVFTLLSGGSYKVWGPEGSFIEDNNHLALALLMTMPLGAYLLSLTSNKKIKNGLLGSLALIGVSILGSSSRGALIGLGAVVLFWMRKAPGKQKLIIFALAIFIGLVAFLIMPQAWWDRMNTVKTYDKDASSMGRINAWWCAYNIAKDRLTGAGFNYYNLQSFSMYAPDPKDVHAAHSIYFQVLGEHGFIGLILFLMIAVWGWFVAGNIVKRTNNVETLKWANDLARMIQLSFVAYFTAGAFLSLSYYDFYWQLIAISVILKGLVERALLAVSIAAETPKDISFAVKKSKGAYPGFVRPAKSVRGSIPET